MVRFSRLTSRAYESIFSISATIVSAESTRNKIDNFAMELEGWRKSIPTQFQPGNSFPASSKSNPTLAFSTLRVHFHYYSVIIALSRLSLSLHPEEISRTMTESRKQLLNAARKIIELTDHIEVKAHTPIW
jgi:hypothetical protein